MNSGHKERMLECGFEGVNLNSPYSNIYRYNSNQVDVRIYERDLTLEDERLRHYMNPFYIEFRDHKREFLVTTASAKTPEDAREIIKYKLSTMGQYV